MVDQAVSLIDLFATACDVADLEAPPLLRGQSLRPLTVDGAASIHDAIFAGINFHAAREPARCVRTERYKYVRRFDGRAGLVLPNVDDTPGKAFLLERDWADQRRDREMLFDLLFDPDEVNNLAGDERARPVLHEMRRRLNRWMVDTSDLLLDDMLVPPAGGRLNSPDQRSPRDPPVTMTGTAPPSPAS